MSGQIEEHIHGLTGLQEGKTFFGKVDERLPQVKPDAFCMVAIDIEHFRLFNKLYGRKEGDYLLRYVSDCIKQLVSEEQGVAGYLGGDNFGILMPNDKELLKQLNADISVGIKKISNTVGFLPAIGVYVIEDTSLLAETIYDRAAIALSHIIGNYTQRICYYDNSMTDKIEEEIKLLSEIQRALEEKEFTFFAQPQCDISSGKIVGAESLVRWIHPEKGMISPGVFIPVLEKNGFIADLDCYVWEQVCEWLKSWVDRGYRPVPMSINVSRIDIFSMNVPEYLLGLIQKYELQTKMLKVEITESAYAENNDKIKRTVKELQDAGFLVMMDDFGSGYSSLNMLKNVAVDVLKIDMRFLDINEKDREKGIGILESVVNMSRQMGLPIIVEGVETKNQEDFLVGMGCRYTQGFYYYRPLPIQEFEKLLLDERKLDFDGLWCKQVEPLHVREFLDSNLFSDAMLNNLLGATAFYDIYENKIEITRVNDQYYQLAGVSSDADANYTHKFWNHVPADEQNQLLSIFESAFANPVKGSEGYVHYMRADGKVLWVYLRVFFLREREGHKLYYSSLTDMTFLKEKKRRTSLAESNVNDLSDKQKKHLEEYYGDMPCAFGVAKIELNENGKPADYDVVYGNRELEKACGSSVSRLRYLLDKLFSDNPALLLEKAYKAAYLGEQSDYYSYSAISGRYLHLTLYQFEYGYASCMLRDETHMRIREQALGSIMLSYKEIYFVHLQDNYYRMIYPDVDHMLERGNYEEAINRWFGTGKILPYDEENIRRFLSIEELKEALASSDTVEYKYKRNFDNKEEWCMVSFCVSERKNGEPKTAVMVVRSIDALIKEEEEQRRQNMSEFLAHTSDGFFIYRAEEDEKILFANTQVLHIFGCETIYEFRELVGGSFRGMVHPDDLERVEAEIAEQVQNSEKREDYVEYRIVRKDGKVRWVTDCGHLDVSQGDNHLFYVFISDVTDRMH